uniref:Uncharacterized protein n=1 Tax=Malurus cyaneus samueli TaxID=2593467 RepID=A0A8C5TIG4_9PASS
DDQCVTFSDTQLCERSLEELIQYAEGCAGRSCRPRLMLGTCEGCKHGAFKACESPEMEAVPCLLMEWEGMERQLK